jgi:hypothetical protein
METINSTAKKIDTSELGKNVISLRGRPEILSVRVAAPFLFLFPNNFSES